MTQAEAVQSEYQIDPVCGMKVLPEKAAGSTEHAGRTWYFCGKGCLAKFEADPAKYDGSQAKDEVKAAAPVVSARGGYVCPMHPEVRSDKPGDCPKCGMALEAVMPSGGAVHVSDASGDCAGCAGELSYLRDGAGGDESAGGGGES